MLPYQPEEVTMCSLPAGPSHLHSPGQAKLQGARQSFSSFHQAPGHLASSSQLRFPPHPDQGPASLPYQGPQDPTYSTMGPLPATYSPPPPDMPSPMAPLNHSIPGLHHSLPPPLSPLPEPMGADLYHVASPPSPWQHFTTHQVQVHDPAATRTFSTNEGSLPRPTAMVHPLPTPMEEDHHPTDLHLPFANERTGTIKLKTSPTEAFARLQ